MEHDPNIADGWFRTAEIQGHIYAQFFVDRMEQQERHTSPGVLLSVTRILYHMSNIFWNNAPAVPAQLHIHIDRKRMRELQELRIALGHRPDDHEDPEMDRVSMGGMTMKGW